MNETTTLIIPRRFAEDRANRDLPLGRGRWLSRGYETTMTDEELADLYSDAVYYSDSTGLDPDYAGLVASAKATVRAIVKAKSR